MRKFDMLLTPPEIGGEVAYEPFPEPGEAVYVTHPAFTYDAALSSELQACSLMLAVAIRMGLDKADKADLAEDKAWLSGKIPIPADRLAGLLENRKEWLRLRGQPLDTPIAPTPPDTQIKPRSPAAQNA